MRKKFLLTMAALLAGVTLAAAQGASNRDQHNTAQPESRQGQAQQSPSSRNSSGTTQAQHEGQGQQSGQRDGQG